MKNVLLIVIDTARAKSFSSLGNKVQTTPALDALGQEGMYFTRCISPAPWTIPSHASIFTGKYPSEHGTSGKNILFNIKDNLASRFKSHGYRTFGISANRLVSSLNGFQEGFDLFKDPWTPFKEKPLEQGLDMIKTQTSNRSYLERLRFILSREGINAHFKKRYGVNQNATYSTNRAMRFVKGVFDSVKEPKFVFVNIMQTHEKYNPPEQYMRKLGYPSKKIQWPDFLGYYAGKSEIDEETRKALRRLYEGELLYADEKINELFEWMRKKKHLENTIVIITSDHGENIGEHDHFSHFFSLHNELLHVPLIIYHPDYLGIGKKEYMVQTHDIHRTLLENVLEVEDVYKDAYGDFAPVNIIDHERKKAVAQLIYPLAFQGVMRRNPDIKEETSELASRQLALFQYHGDKMEKICWDSKKGTSVYNLEDDWAELKPLDLDSAQQERVKKAIDDAARMTNFTFTEDNKADVPEEIRRQLSDLGYM